MRNILKSDLDGITIQDGRILKTKDVTENELTFEQKEFKRTLTKTNISYENILKNI